VTYSTFTPHGDEKEVSHCPTVDIASDTVQSDTICFSLGTNSD
jgi:hypothetical protein